MAKRMQRSANVGVNGLVSYRPTAKQVDSRDAMEFSPLWTDPANRLAYDPGEKQIIPKAGAWIMITRRLPPIEGNLDKLVRVGEIYWAFHHSDSDAEGFRPTGLYNVFISVAKQQPVRELTLWPYEYAKMSTGSILACWEDSEIVFHPKDSTPWLLNQQVFYARSRGIALEDALVMALGTIEGDIGWFEPVPELAQACEAMEERAHRWRPTRRKLLSI